MGRTAGEICGEILEISREIKIGGVRAGESSGADAGVRERFL